MGEIHKRIRSFRCVKDFVTYTHTHTHTRLPAALSFLV